MRRGTHHLANCIEWHIRQLGIANIEDFLRVCRKLAVAIDIAGAQLLNLR